MLPGGYAALPQLALAPLAVLMPSANCLFAACVWNCDISPIVKCLKLACFARPYQVQTERLLLSLGYGANVATSYLLMLAIMTYNVGYFITIVVGLSVGHFLLFNAPPQDASGSGILS